MVIVTKSAGYVNPVRSKVSYGVKELDFSEERLYKRLAKALEDQRVSDESFWGQSEHECAEGSKADGRRMPGISEVIKPLLVYQ